MQQPKVLFIMRHRGPISVNKAQIELVVELKNKGVDIAICGLLDQNVTEYFDSKGIAVFHLFPKKSIDKNFIVAIKELILKEGFNTLHVLRGKELRNICIALKNKPKVKIIAYIGSVSVYWYDPTTYLTYLNPRVNAIICNSQFVYEHVTKQLPKSKDLKPQESTKVTTQIGSILLILLTIPLLVSLKQHW